jgi:hypothetical protein
MSSESSYTSGSTPNRPGKNRRNKIKAKAAAIEIGGTTTKPSGRGFKGNTEGMNGHVFECYEEHTDRHQFTRTLNMLGEYADKNLKEADDLKPIFQPTMTVPVIERPSPPSRTNVVIRKQVM